MKRTLLLLFAFFILAISSCRHANKEEDTSGENVKARAPVSVTGISREGLASTISLNAVSSFLKKSILKSSASGYIKEINVTIGNHVKTGQIIFMLQTKEAAAYKNLNINDSTLYYTGNISVMANDNGLVTNIPHVAGDFIQEGDELCSIAEQNSLVFLLEVPYELHELIHENATCTISLPDARKLKGNIESRLSDMDAASQTQRYIIRPVSYENIPENLLANISIVKSNKENAVTLPKDAVLTNETQSEFWVMKLVNDSTAVKTVIKPGIREKDKVEILSPDFNEHDLFVTSGSYGLPDTATVIITK